MNDTRNGKVYASLFLLFIVCLIVGGYYLTIKLTRESDNKEPLNKQSEEEKIEEDKLKLEKDKEYMYFINSDNKSLEHEITYQDIVININSEDAKSVASKLNSEMSELTKTFKKISEEEIPEEDEEKILYKEDDIYSATFKKYTRYFYKNYASLLSEDYDYDCFNGPNYKSSYAYVFDTNTGKLLTNDELLKLHNLSLSKVKEIIKEKLEKNGEMVEDKPLIDIPATINNLDNPSTFALYINKSGFLTISYLVKTIEVDYNDVIILN